MSTIWNRDYNTNGRHTFRTRTVRSRTASYLVKEESHLVVVSIISVGLSGFIVPEGFVNIRGG